MIFRALFVEADMPVLEPKSELDALENGVVRGPALVGSVAAVAGGALCNFSEGLSLVGVSDAEALFFALRPLNGSTITVNVFLLEVVRPSVAGLRRALLELGFGVTRPWRACDKVIPFSSVSSAEGSVASDFSEGTRGATPFGCSLLGAVPKILPSPILSMERPLRCLLCFDDRESVDPAGLWTAGETSCTSC